MCELWPQIFDMWIDLNFCFIDDIKAERDGVYIAAGIGCWICPGWDNDCLVDCGGCDFCNGWGLQFEFVIREDVGFVVCTVCVKGGGRATDCFAGWTSFCNRLCAASRDFISITSPSTM